MDIAQIFEKYEDQFLEFKDIENPPSKRSDICAFLLLDKLCPGSRDMVSSAEHDEIYLDVSIKALAKVATEEDILYLVRCGVRYDSDTESLCMLV